jgi:hypothetical protein
LWSVLNRPRFSVTRVDFTDDFGAFELEAPRTPLALRSCRAAKKGAGRLRWLSLTAIGARKTCREHLPVIFFGERGQHHVLGVFEERCSVPFRTNALEVSKVPSRPAVAAHRVGGAWRLPAFVVALAMATLAAIVPPETLPQLIWPDGAPVSDKALHLLGFAGLGCVFGLLFRRALSGMIGLFLFGLGLEGAQAWAGLGRQGDPQDAVANVLGLAIALVAIGCWRALWALRPSLPPAAQP